LLIANESDATRSIVVPRQLDLRLTATGRAFNITLYPAPPLPAPEVQLAPQAFRRVAFRGEVPRELEGSVTAQARNLEAVPLLLVVTAPADSPAPSAPPEAEATPVAQEERERPRSSPEQALLSAISTYEPVYLAIGPAEESNAKVQFSFKFRFFTEDGPLVERLHFLKDFYFGYTQTALWDLDSESKPFRDSSYKPRLFYYKPDIWTGRGRTWTLGVESGYGHESNGKDGSASRSIDIAYVKPLLNFGLADGWHWHLGPMIYGYLDKEDNPDIEKYRGYVDLFASVGKADRWKLAGMFRRGTGDGWSAQLDLSYPLGAVALGNLNGYIHLQYFDGWGETLLEYNRRVDPQYRLGLMLVR
jgi:outer membrane phospholipase A